MDNFLNKLCLRRLCLPSTTDMKDLRSGCVKSPMCDCGNSHHIACTFEKGYCFQSFELWDKHV